MMLSVTIAGDVGFAANENEPTLARRCERRDVHYEVRGNAGSVEADGGGDATEKTVAGRLQMSSSSNDAHQQGRHSRMAQAGHASRTQVAPASQ